MRRESANGVACVLLVGALFSLAILTELPYVNGPDYWSWPWRTLPFDRAFALFAAPALFFGYLLREWCLNPAPTRGEVARLIASIAQDPNPKLRYLVGRDAKIQLAMKRILPWKWHEKVIAALSIARAVDRSLKFPPLRGVHR